MAASAEVGPGDRLSLWDKLLAARDQLLSSPRFQRVAADFPLTRPIANRYAAELFDLVAGFAYSQILLTCVRLRLFDQLRPGPLSTGVVAQRIGLPAERAERLLKAAAALDLVSARSGGRWALGRLGAALLGNPGAIAMIEHHDALYTDLADPVALFRRGRGQKVGAFWPYASDARAVNETDTAAYTRLMAQSQPLVAADILEAYPFAEHRRLLDVGGGDGSFALAVKARHPSLSATVFDLPPVAEAARRRFAEAGVDAEAIPGDFHRDALPGGADLVTLVRIVHDHDDDAVLALLRAARAAVAPGGTVLIAEPLAAARGAKRVGDAYFGVYFLAMGSGRARSAAELALMAKAAGFVEAVEIPTPRPLLTGLIRLR